MILIFYYFDAYFLALINSSRLLLIDIYKCLADKKTKA